ncbi:unnamed protein product [Ectocarpus sp. 6 AP-2014]
MFRMRVATLCVVGVLAARPGRSAVATVWTSTKIQGEGRQQQQPESSKPTLDVEARVGTQPEPATTVEEAHGVRASGGDGARHSGEATAAGYGAPASVISGGGDATEGLSFVSSNEYLPTTGSPWTHLAEPFRDTTFTASSILGRPDADVFKWSFEDGTMLEGREVKHNFKTLGRQRVSLSQIVVSTGNTHETIGSVMVKYVRREIRSLTDKDREAFFDAMETLYRLPTVEGHELYGEEYKGINFFVQMHLNGAGVSDCDHWHDDAGIMTHHVGYTLLFEQALQVVDPAVTIPYWEYTIEAAAGLEDYDSSEVFASDWFGEASPDNELHTVDKGRWAFLPVMEASADAWHYVHNPYGLLRSPWNTDPTPYVTRHNATNNKDVQGVVSCDDYQSCFDKDNLADMNNCLNGGTHGPVHIKVGGEWNDPQEGIIQALGYTNKVPLMSKYLWRKGYLRMPTSCSVESEGTGDASTCRSSCPAELYESKGMKPYDVLMDVYALHWIAESAGGIVVWDNNTEHFTVAGHEHDAEFMEGLWTKVLTSLCDPGHVGELYSSSAPYDPLFWVIHPTAERFMGWKRKLARERPDVHPFSEDWGYTHGNVVGETGMVCDWSGVRQGTLDMPTCVKGICGGHSAGDLLPFRVKIGGEVRKMTNAEWLDFIYPDNEELPYMYDSFGWDHCAASGYLIGAPAPEGDD